MIAIDADVAQVAIRRIGAYLNFQFCISLEKILPALNAARAYLLLTTLTHSSYE
ncbi:MAG TPA: hypothetical protein VIH18_18890 [Candidatus Binatia bacterium]